MAERKYIMTLNEAKQLKTGTEVNFKHDSLVCGTAYYTGIVLKTATDKNEFTELKYTGDNYGYCNVEPDDILSIVTQ
jgi:hypothetical protein